MIINKKIFFKSYLHGGKHVLVNQKENKIYEVSAEIMKQNLLQDILPIYNNDEEKALSNLENEWKKVKYKIESAFIEFNPNKPEGLYKENDFYYYNFFKNTDVRKKMLEIYVEHKKKGNLKNDVLSIVEKFPFVNLLFDSLTNFNKEYKKYFLNWLAYVFITHKKTMNTIIFKGIEGTGKGLLFEKIIQKVFPINQTTVISNDELNNSFNEFLENKSFIIANEVQDYTNKKSVYEKLKQWITDEMVNLNAKHTRMRNATNFVNFLIFSNNDYPVPITITDRRYSVINTSDEKLEILSEKYLNLNIIEYVERLKNEVELFLYELAKYNFNELEAKKILINKERENIIFNTEEKTKILKRKLKELDVNFLQNEFITEYLFDVDNEKYFEITQELKLGNINNNIEETHKFIVDDIIEAIKTKNFIPTNYLKYLLFFMYYQQKELKELNKYMNKIGEKTKKTIWFRNTAHRGIIVKPINKNINVNNIDKDEIIENLQKENQELKQKLNDLETKLEKNKELENFKKYLVEKNILTKEQLEKICNDFLDDSIEKSFSLL